MKIIPAIDILDNEAVRLFKGDYNQKTVYSKEPWELVKTFSKHGADWLHLVDLNGARNASTVNQECIQKIRTSAPDIKIQLGGGIRNIERLKFYQSMGIDRFIIGTSAVTNPEFVEEGLELVGADHLAIAVDAKEGMVRIQGWETKTEIHFMELLSRLKEQGVKIIIFTDISLDGTLSGPNLESYKQILDTFSFELIASGGISSLKDIIDLTMIQSKHPLSGIITGKAIYEGKLSLQEAIHQTSSIH
jgi:phosphoribosylformimino-5-aminoimidazole carboxamide ribotide isomerase